MIRKRMNRNKILGTIRNKDSLSKLTRNKFALQFSTKKGMRKNEEEKIFLTNGNIFEEH